MASTLEKTLEGAIYSSAEASLTSPWIGVFQCNRGSDNCPKLGKGRLCFCIPIIKGAGWTGGDKLALKVSVPEQRRLMESITRFFLQCSAQIDFLVKVKELETCRAQYREKSQQAFSESEKASQNIKVVANEKNMKLQVINGQAHDMKEALKDIAISSAKPNLDKAIEAKVRTAVVDLPFLPPDHDLLKSIIFDLVSNTKKRFGYEPDHVNDYSKTGFVLVASHSSADKNILIFSFLPSSVMIIDNAQKETRTTFIGYISGNSYKNLGADWINSAVEPQRDKMDCTNKKTSDDRTYAMMCTAKSSDKVTNKLLREAIVKALNVFSSSNADLANLKVPGVYIDGLRA